MDMHRFDRRVIKRNLNSGIVSEKEYKKHLADLKNLEKDHEVIVVSLYGSDEDEEAAAEEATEEGEES